MPPSVSALFIHPIKSAAATSVTTLLLDELGACDDRRWMLVDLNGKFFTQREHSALALIRPTVNKDGLLLQCDGQYDVFVRTPSLDSARAHAVIWEAVVKVLDAGEEAAIWCSNVIGTECRLVYLAPDSARPLIPRYAGSVNWEGRTVALSDGAPLLVIGEASLTLLNERLLARGVPAVGIDRFRPNIVVSGTAPHEEDTWRTIRIGATTFGVGSPCPRCIITTIEQSTGRRSTQRVGESGGEPLRTLAQYRRDGSGVMFGMNVTNATAGRVQIGDSVLVTELR